MGLSGCLPGPSLYLVGCLPGPKLYLFSRCSEGFESLDRARWIESFWGQLASGSEAQRWGGGATRPVNGGFGGGTPFEKKGFGGSAPMTTNIDSMGLMTTNVGAVVLVGLV